MTDRPQPRAHACAICGAENAQFGYRLPGLLSSLPADKQRYLWVCAAHREDALARQQAATIISRP